MTKAICAQCGSEYRPRKGVRHCSRACRMMSIPKVLERPCKACGTSFTGDSNRQVYCTRPCYLARPIDRAVCPCGKVIIRKGNKYCSQLCFLRETKAPIGMELTVDRLREVLFYEPATGQFFWRVHGKGYGGKRSPGDLAGSNRSGYIQIGIDGVTYVASRLAWLYTHGSWPSRYIDHKDGNSLNNALSNLREATPSQNTMNAKMSSSNTSGVKGVQWDRNAWKAVIGVGGKMRHLGRFARFEDAVAARKKAQVELHGEFSRDR